MKSYSEYLDSLTDVELTQHLMHHLTQLEQVPPIEKGILRSQIEKDDLQHRCALIVQRHNRFRFLDK